jgi:hypothetical protein
MSGINNQSMIQPMNPAQPNVPTMADLFPYLQNIQMQPMQSRIDPMSSGVARFLQGNTAPMMLDFNLPAGMVPTYNIPQYTPGPFDIMAENARYKEAKRAAKYGSADVGGYVGNYVGNEGGE